MPPDPSPPSKGKILVVDDEPHARLIMSEAVKAMGFEATVAENGMKALEHLRFGHYDVLITDMQMPGMDGIRLLENAATYDATVSVVLATAHGSIETAVEAMKKGAEDYVLKPVEFSQLEVVLDRVFKKRSLVQENRRLASENESLKKDLVIKYRLTNTIGRSPRTLELMKRIEQQMKLRTPLLILGERGTGKSEVARMVHFNGPWAQGPLIFFDCTELPVELHENQLVGEEMKVEGGVKTQSRPGLVERANQGTLAITNVDRLGKTCQPHLSRVLREQRTQRGGGSKFYPVNVRIIATSSREKFDKVARGSGLRWDIHDLLLENMIEVPALKDRAEDIPVLVAATAKRIGDALGKSIEKIDRPVIEMLAKYDFPCNTRELESIVESAVSRCDDTTLKLDHFRMRVV